MNTWITTILVVPIRDLTNSRQSLGRHVQQKEKSFVARCLVASSMTIDGYHQLHWLEQENQFKLICKDIAWCRTMPASHELAIHF
jgi:hypothetical protein